MLKILECIRFLWIRFVQK